MFFNLRKSDRINQSEIVHQNISSLFFSLNYPIKSYYHKFQFHHLLNNNKQTNLDLRIYLNKTLCKSIFIKEKNIKNIITKFEIMISA